MKIINVYIILTLLFSLETQLVGISYDSYDLLEEARHGNNNIVEFLISQGIDVNYKSRQGQTALMFAVNWSQKNTVELLLAKGADVNAQNQRGKTALMYAAGGGYKDVVELLLAKGANAKDIGGALMNAAGKGHIDVVELLIAKGADVNAKDQEGETALIFAASRGQKDVVELLIAKGADVNAKSEDGRTALMMAASGGYIDVVELLIAKGADVKAQDNSGQNAYARAKRYGRKDVEIFLLRVQKDLKAPQAVKDIITFARTGDLEKVKAAFEKGGKAEFTDATGLTPLMYAAFSGHGPVVNYLLAKKANANAHDKNGLTVLMYAVFSGKKEVVELLLKNGAKVNSTDRKSETALMKAADLGQDDIIELLIGNGATVDLKDKNYNTALTRATVSGHTGTVTLLLGKGANSSINNKLLVAVIKGDIIEAEKALTDGADINAKDSDNNTILMWATLAGHTGIVEKLIKKGADPDLENNRRETALDLIKFKVPAIMSHIILETAGALLLDTAIIAGIAAGVIILSPVAALTGANLKDLDLGIKSIFYWPDMPNYKKRIKDFEEVKAFLEQRVNAAKPLKKQISTVEKTKEAVKGLVTSSKFSNLQEDNAVFVWLQTNIVPVGQSLYEQTKQGKNTGTLNVWSLLGVKGEEETRVVNEKYKNDLLRKIKQDKKLSSDQKKRASALVNEAYNTVHTTVGTFKENPAYEKPAPTTSPATIDDVLKNDEVLRFFNEKVTQPNGLTLFIEEKAGDIPVVRDDTTRVTHSLNAWALLGLSNEAGRTITLPQLEEALKRVDAIIYAKDSTLFYEKRTRANDLLKKAYEVVRRQPQNKDRAPKRIAVAA